MAKVPDEHDADSPNAASAVDDTLTMPEAGAAHGPQTPRSSPVTRLTTTEVYGDRYVIRRELARGGMGRVLLATDLHLDRDVAIKELIDESPHIVNRFEREVRLTAKLQHPSIVSIFDTGRTRVGKRYYVMRQIPGRPLSAAIAAARTTNERLALLPHVIAISEALAYSHQQRIIHRDLKSGNVLIGPFGETIVIDWGLAKAIDEASDEVNVSSAASTPSSPDMHLTSAGMIIGTPAFMSPEQARGSVVDERSDVYSIGAILWQLLTGKPPYDGSTSDEILDKILRGPPSLGDAPRGVPADLIAISRKACEYDPSNRYKTAAELAVDLRNFEAGQLVAAHRYSSGELVARWIRRNSRPVAVAAVAVIALTAFGVFTIGRIIRERQTALQKATEAQAARAVVEQRNAELILTNARAFLPADPVQTLAWLKQYPVNATKWGAARLLAAEAFDRGVPRTVLRGHSDLLWSLRFSSDGRKLISASDDRTIRVWDLATRTSRVLRGEETSIYDATLSPDGKTLFSVGGDRRVVQWNLADGSKSVLTEQDEQIGYIAINSLGTHLLTKNTDGDHALHLIELATHTDRPLGHNEPRKWVEATFSPDGRSVYRWEQGTIYVLDLLTGIESPILRTRKEAWRFALSPDGAWLAAPSVDGNVTLADSRGRHARTIKSDVGGVFLISFLGDSTHLAALCGNGSIAVAEVSSKDLAPVGHCDDCFLVPATVGSRFATVEDKRIVIWDAATKKNRVLVTGSWTDFRAAKFSPDGATLASSSHGDAGEIRIWSVEVPDAKKCKSGAKLWAGVFLNGDRDYVAWGDKTLQHYDRMLRTCTRLDEVPGRFVGAYRSPNGKSLLTASDDGALRLWSINTKSPQTVAIHDGGVASAVYSPDGKHIFSLGKDQTIRAWDSTLRPLEVIGKNPSTSPGHSILTDGRWIVTVDDDGVAWAWDVVTRQSRRIRDRISKVAMSTRGQLVAMTAKRPDGSGSVESVPIFLESLDGRKKLSLIGHTNDILSLRFSADDSLLISGANDATARIWNTADGKSRGIFPYDLTVTAAKLFDADRYLVVAGTALTVRIYDINSHERRTFDVDDDVFSVSTSDDGKTIIVPTRKGDLFEWNDPVPLAPADVLEWLKRTTDVSASSQSPI